MAWGQSPATASHPNRLAPTRFLLVSLAAVLAPAGCDEIDEALTPPSSIAPVQCTTVQDFGWDFSRVFVDDEGEFVYILYDQAYTNNCDYDTIARVGLYYAVGSSRYFTSTAEVEIPVGATRRLSNGPLCAEEAANGWSSCILGAVDNNAVARSGRVTHALKVCRVSENNSAVCTFPIP